MALNKRLLVFAKTETYANNPQELEQKLIGACSNFGLELTKDYNLAQIKISNPKPSSLGFKFSFNSTLNDSSLNKFCQILNEQEIDVFAFKQKPVALKLALFDMDSTLIQAEVMDELARLYGVYDQVSSITEAAMAGDIDFNESFIKRLAMLKDMPTDDLEKIRAKIKLTPNAEILFTHLNKKGIETLLVSGGFDYFASYFAEKLGIKEYHANILEAKQKKLTGVAILPILDSDFKRRILEQKQMDLTLSASQVLAVGDGANDIPMLLKAGIGVAYKAKPLVQKEANFNLKFNDLDSLAYLLYLN